MKKIALTIISVFVGLIILYIVINLFDSTLNPNAYTLDDIPSASFDTSNGFYILWGLAEPGNVDVQSEEYIRKIRKFFDPEFGYEDYEKNRGKFGKYLKVIREIRFPWSFDKDWITALSSQGEKIEKARQVAALPLRRYQQLITTPTFEEFTPPRFNAPIPDILAWLIVAKLYTASCTTDAVNGKWEESVEKIVDHINFTKKVIASSRTIFINLIAKGVMKISLQGLVSIMNHPGCPKSVYPLVLSGMPPLKYEEYGSRNSLVVECLSCFTAVEHLDIKVLRRVRPGPPKFLHAALFMQKNRTKNYFYEFYSHLISYDMQEPYLWKGDPFKEAEESVKKKKGIFWWLQNPVGKILFEIAVLTTSPVISKSYRTRAYYEMTRILAELHMNDSGKKSVADILKELKSYKTHDPCSGDPYIWDNKKKVLYSIGIDRVNNGGVDHYTPVTNTDFTIPVVLKAGVVKKR